MAQVNFRMDDRLKAQADAEFRQMGLTFSAAITLLCTQVVLKHRLPFSIEAAGAAAQDRRAGGFLCGDGDASSLPSARGKSPGARFVEFVEKNPIAVPADFKWSRQEAAERKMKCLS